MKFLSILFITLTFVFAAEVVPQIGLKAEMEKRWDDAVTVYLEILQKEPRRSDLYLRIADIHSSQKRYSEAENALKKAIDIEPKRAVFYKKLSEIYAVQNEPDKAIIAIRSAIKHDPKNIKYRIAHARLANWNKKFLDAINDLKYVLKADPNNKEARLLLARSYEWGGLPEEALAYYTAHLRKDPTDLHARLDLADIQEFFGDITSANKTLEVGFKQVRQTKSPAKATANSASVDVPILLYHCVDTTPQNDYWIATDEFDAQMQLLSQNSYESVSTKDIHDYSNYGTSLPEKPVVISFDDGCQNLYTKAYPILKKYGFIAEIYLIADAIGDIESERLNSGAKEEAAKLGETGGTSVTGYLTWPEVKEMSDNGIVFGSHSKSHPLMSGLDDANLSYQLLYSKLAIIANTGVEVTSFAYPFGDGAGKKEIHHILDKYDFTTAVAANGGIVNTGDVSFLNIPRVSVYGVKPELDPQSKGVSVISDPTRPADGFMAKLQPSEAERQFELSNRHTAVNELDKALIAINKAVELEPENIRYLLTRLFASGALDKRDIALDSARRAYKVDPENDENLLRLANTEVWVNHLDHAAYYHKIYQERNPDKKEGYLEYTQVEAWRGGYATALKILERYREKFGEDEQYRTIKAEVLTWADRPTKAFDILDLQLKKEPNNYKANFTNTVALNKDGQIVESIESLEKVEEIQPDSQDNLFLRKYITTNLRHSVRAGGEYYIDSDNVSMHAGEVEGKYFLSPLTSIFALWHVDYVSLSNNYPLNYTQDDGSESATHNSLRVGVNHRISSKLTAKLSAGTAKAEEHNDPVYGAGLSYDPIDGLMIELSYDHHYFIVTPKTIGRGTINDSVRMHIYAEPTNSMYVDFSAGFDELSDAFNDNSQWNVSLAPTWAVLRRQNWNFDLGLSAIAYGYDKQSQFYDLGYYAPKWSQSYYITTFTNWKISDDDSISLAVNGGMFKDNNMDRYKFGGGVHLEGVFGLYRDWMLKVGAGTDYSARYYDQSYSAFSGSLYITRRF